MLKKYMGVITVPVCQSGVSSDCIQLLHVHSSSPPAILMIFVAKGKPHYRKSDPFAAFAIFWCLRITYGLYLITTSLHIYISALS